MNDIAARYRSLAVGFTARVAAVPDERWSNPSPCAEWTALDVVGHMVEVHGRMLGFVDRELGPVPSVDEDPLGAWTAARDVVQADLDDPQRAAAAFDGYFGRTTFAESVDRFVCFDLLIHGWDLARATGQDETLDLDEVRRVAAQAEAFGDMLHSSGACGPAVEAPAGADEQQRLLAYLGRHP